MATPLMNLTLPTPGPGGTAGPGYATDNNTAFTVVDGHDHSSGKGALVKTAGLLIDADFSIRSFNLTTIRATKYDDQAAVLGAGDVRAIYVVNGDLHYNNSAGAAVRITDGTGLNAASIGGIGGDYATSAANVSYNDTTKVFTFTQSAGISAHLAVGEVAIFEAVSSANGITVKSPSALASSYDFTLPAALPGTTQLLRMTAAGLVDPVTTIPVLDITTSQIVNLKVRNPADTFSYNIVASAIVADRNLTLPLLTGNDTFTLNAFAQTLTNKTLTSPVLTTPQINDTSADHQYIFAVSELVADRTVTMPLLTGNDSFVFEAHTQTLTNKALTSPQFGGTVTGTYTLGGTPTITSPTINSPSLTSPAVTSGNLTVNAGSKIVVDDPTDSTSPTTGSIQTDGGSGVVKDAYFGAGIFMSNTSPAIYWVDTNASVDEKRWRIVHESDVFRLRTITDAGVDVQNAFSVTRTGTTVDLFSFENGQVRIDDATASTTKDTGALVLSAGGLGVELDINAGGDVDAGGNIDATGTIGGMTSAEMDQVANIGATLISLTNWQNVANLDTAVTAAEWAQLANIGATTISATQWGFLGALDQGLATTDNVTFASVTTTSAVVTDTINERTAAAGVTIDSVLLKDNAVTATTLTANTSVVTDTVSEKTAAAGVTIDSVLLKDNGIQTDSGGTNEILRTKVIEIGDWNMDATTTVSIAHGLTLANIRNILVTIRRDGGLIITDFPTYSNAGTTNEMASAGAVNVDLNRSTGGQFDNTNYDSTAFNRGWIKIVYAV